MVNRELKVGQELKFENVKKGSCVICSEPIEESNIWLCMKCFGPCQKIVYSQPLEIEGNKMLLDAKSNCCNADIKFLGRITCSKECHEKFVKSIEREFGEVKKVIDDTTGIVYRVPTRDIIEKGLTWNDLYRYPQWNDK